jgi:hypothetical protein
MAGIRALIGIRAAKKRVHMRAAKRNLVAARLARVKAKVKTRLALGHVTRARLGR